MDYNYDFNDLGLSETESLFDYYDYIITFCDFINNEDMKKDATIAIYRDREETSNRIVNCMQENTILSDISRRIMLIGVILF